MKIGNVIAELRREHGIKQEELADYVGVSAQAVSKWECGGMPDAELLPKIADFFKISIDSLFSRDGDYNDLRNTIAAYIAGHPETERMTQAFELCRAIQWGLMGYSNALDTIDELNSMDMDLPHLKPYDDGIKQLHSPITTDDGLSMMSVLNRLQYFFLMPEPKSGFTKGLYSPEKYAALFEFLGGEGVMDALFLIYKTPSHFSRGFFEKELGLTAERADEILDKLCEYGFAYKTELAFDGETREMYRLYDRYELMALLAVAGALIAEGGYGPAQGILTRQKPWL